MASQYRSPQPFSQADEKTPFQYESTLVNEDEDRLSKAAAADQRLKHKVRRLRVIQRTVNLFLSIIVLGIMLNTYLTFTHNRTATAADGSVIAIYPTKPITWPTFMMLGTSAVSLIFNITIITAYFCSVGAANRVNSYAGYYGYAVHILNFAVWLGTSTTFKMMQGAADEVPPPNDLWGWTCSNAADALTAELPHIVNFSLQCTTQQVSFGVGLATAGFEIFGIIVNIIAMRRMIHKKKMSYLEHRQNSRMSAAR